MNLYINHQKYNVNRKGIGPFRGRPHISPIAFNSPLAYIKSPLAQALICLLRFSQLLKLVKFRREDGAEEVWSLRRSSI